LAFNQLVAGSNPARPTIYFLLTISTDRIALFCGGVNDPRMFLWSYLCLLYLHLRPVHLL
jgi:hypothetical protein